MIITVYLVFTEGKSLFTKFEKQGFNHLITLQKDKYNWMKIDPLHRFLYIKILPYGADDKRPLQFYLNKQNTKVLEVTYEPKQRRVYAIGFINFMTCVSVTKYILGIKNICITPYSLYKWLLKKKDKQIISVKPLN